MEGGLPMLDCLLQHTLRSFCSSSETIEPCKWVYGVFWRILPRNYPPPKWEYGGGVLDRAKGNKRNWILVWEDGYCNFNECERAAPRDEYVKGRFGADVFFKMSHEVYNYGEGLLGKVAAENSHRWVFRPTSNNASTCFSAWNVSVDNQPKAWESQFNSGIQTIALISVRDGIVQLGSLDKVQEDLNLVMSTQRKFSFLENIFTIQRPNSIQCNASTWFVAGSKRQYDQGLTETSMKSINLGWNSPQNGLLLSKPPYVAQSNYPINASELDLIDNNTNGSMSAPSVKVESECVEEDKSSTFILL